MEQKISTAMASFCRLQTVEESLRLVKAAGFDSVDFPLSAYSGGFQAPLLQENWRQWVRNVSALCQSLSLPVTQAHAPWDQAIGEGFRYEAPREIIYRAIEACHMLGCRHLIFHPLRQSDRMDSPAMAQRIHDYNVRWFYELLPAAERFDVVINLENTFDSHHTQKPGDPPYPYTTAEDMLRLARDIGSNRVRLCLDTGHANIEKQDIPAMIRAFRSELATVHLNDNYGPIRPVYEDLHLFPGYGRIEWAPIFEALRQIGFRGTMNMEPIGELKHLPNDLRLIQLRAAADTLRLLSSR